MSDILNQERGEVKREWKQLDREAGLSQEHSSHGDGDSRVGTADGAGIHGSV